MAMSPVVVAFGLIFAPLCWAERHELRLQDDLVNYFTAGAEAGAHDWAGGASKVEGSTRAAISVHGVAGNLHPDAAQRDGVSFTEEQAMGEEAMTNLEAKQEGGDEPRGDGGDDEPRGDRGHEPPSFTETLQGMTNLEAKQEPADSNTVRRDTQIVMSLEHKNSSFVEGASAEGAGLLDADPGDAFLDFLEWWSSNAAQPVSVQWNPVAEARATTQRCGQRVINLAQTTKEVAEKMMKLTNDLGFMFVSLPPAARIAKGLLQEMVRQDGMIDKLEKGDLESLAGFGSYAQAASYAKMMYNEVQKQKAALTLPLKYGESMSKTVQEIGALLGVPPAAAPPALPVLDQVRGMTREGQAAMAKAQPKLAGLQRIVSTLGMPALGVEIGNVNGELGKLEVQFQHAERHAEKLQQKSTGGLILHGLGVMADKIQGSGLSPEDNIRKQLAAIGKSMAIYTRNLLRMYLDFEKKLATYKDQFVQAVNNVLSIFTQLGVQVADFFNQLATAQLSSAQQMLSSTCQCVSL
jgi:hypothetical protein